jgi:vacuolar-type H+-ATPase subunit I/STV1
VRSPFVHLELLGPRGSVDSWLSAVQEHGTCHLADALRGHEAQAGIHRPAPTPAERRAEALRSEAAVALRSVEAALPATSSTGPGTLPPRWSVGGRGEGEPEVEAVTTEALSLARVLRGDLEAADAAERAARDVDAAVSARRALADLGVEAESGRCYALPLETTGAAGLVRRLRRIGLDATAVEGGRELVVACAVGGDAGEEADAVAAAAGARHVAHALPAAPEDPAADDISASPEDRLRAAEQREKDARSALVARLASDGPRVRHLLDTLEDAEARSAARERLAATEHVVAARVFVRREDEAPLRARLEREFGGVVVARPLAEADDVPTLPRSVAGTPFAALRSLHPGRFGEVAAPSLLALAVPVIVGLLWADIGGGLLLLLVGALVGAGAPVGSPRRDTALLSQVGGLAALIMGILDGRAFGAAGAAVFGTGWGLAPGGSALPVSGDPLRDVVGLLGFVALLLAAWGGLSAAVALRVRRSARARSAAVGALHFLTVAGAAAAVLPSGDALQTLWILAPAAALGVLVLAGLRAGWGRLTLDLVGVLRLGAVATLALLLFRWAFAALGDPTAVHLVLAPALLAIGALAVLVDPAHVAMGVPYDLSLGTRGLAVPFEPFAGRARRPVGRLGSA